MTSKHYWRKNILYIFSVCVVTAIVTTLLVNRKFTKSSKTILSTYPKVKSDQYLYPQPWTIIDRKIYYIINNPVCADSNYILMIILVTSYFGDVEIRQKIREAMPTSELYRLNMRRIFLLSLPNQSNSSNKYPHVNLDQVLKLENEQHHDLLVGSFTESYHNLTYKHLMGLQWSQQYCSQATFILKQDDDIIVDFYQIASQHLNAENPSEIYKTLLSSNVIWGKELSNMEVIRDVKSKWYVSYDEYKRKYYPSFVSGWTYITTMKVIKNIVASAKIMKKYFWIDDIVVTGSLRQLTNIKILDMSKYFTTFKGQLFCCVSSSAVSNPKIPYWCDFIVGPTNGDFDFMKLFYSHSQFCYTTNTCVKRQESETLDKKCVITPEMVIFNSATRSNSVRKNNKGSWKTIKLYQKIYRDDT